jgi:hypothetical protein
MQMSQFLADNYAIAAPKLDMGCCWCEDGLFRVINLDSPGWNPRHIVNGKPMKCNVPDCCDFDLFTAG